MSDLGVDDGEYNESIKTHAEVLGALNNLILPVVVGNTSEINLFINPEETKYDRTFSKQEKGWPVFATVTLFMGLGDKVKIENLVNVITGAVSVIDPHKVLPIDLISSGHVSIAYYSETRTVEQRKQLNFQFSGNGSISKLGLSESTYNKSTRNKDNGMYGSDAEKFEHAAKLLREIFEGFSLEFSVPQPEPLLPQSV